MAEYTYYSTGTGFMDRYRVEHAVDGFHVQKVISMLRRPAAVNHPYSEIIGTGETCEAAITIIQEHSKSVPVRMRNPFPD